jgi:2-phosphosulfolactate phosphatase
MQVVESRGIAGAAAAAGHVVVIDVLRAFTTAAHALHAGAREVRLVGTPEEAFALREAVPDAVLVGEVGGRPIRGFDFGNSPDAVGRADLRGKTVLLRSSSGVQGALTASGAEAMCLGSLVTASATVAWLRKEAPSVVTLVAMGAPQGPDGEEDDACSAYLAALLRGGFPDPAATRTAVVRSPAGRMALDPAVEWISAADLACATAIDRFDFAVVAERREGALVARARRSG